MNSLTARLLLSLTTLLALAITLAFIYPIILLYFPGSTLLLGLGFPCIFMATFVVCSCFVFDPVRKKIYGLAVPGTTFEKAPDKDTQKIAGTISAIVLAGFGLIVILLMFDYVGHKNIAPFDGVGGSLGTFGDFFGGVLNPLLTFVTFIALAITIVLQRIQLKEAREQGIESGRLTRQQAFETTFFNLLDLHASTVEHLEMFPGDVVFPCSDGTKEKRSSENLKGYRGDLPSFSGAKGRSVFTAMLLLMQEKSQVAENDKIPLLPEEIYTIIQSDHNPVLGHYFRNLYQILSFIDTHAPMDDSLSHPASSAKRYANILRAQLSANEIALLYFNCMGELVGLAPFRALLKKYEMLEYMPVSCIDIGNQLVIARYNLMLDQMRVFEYAKGLQTGEVTDFEPGAFGANTEIQCFLDNWRRRKRPTDIDTTGWMEE